MNKNIKNKKNKKLLTVNKVNKYDDGGWKDMSTGEKVGGIASAATGAIQLISGALNTANKIDTSKADNAIAAVDSFQPQANSMEGLASQLNSFEEASTNWKGSDFGMSTKEGLTSLGTSMASGAAAGAALGPWGAAAGAAAGLITAGAGWIANAVKSKSKADELNRMAEAANYRANQKQVAAIDTFKEKETDNFMSNIASYGGPIYNHSGDWSNGITFINEGGTHEENPYDGVLMGFDQEGIPNLVEEGEIIYNDYVFSNRLKPTKKQLENCGLNKKYTDWTFAKIVEDLQKPSAETPLDKISKDSLDDIMNTMISLQEEVRMKKGLKGQNRLMANGGNIFGGLSDHLPKDPNGFKGFEYYNDGNYSQGYLDYINNLSVESPVYKEALNYYDKYKGTDSGNEKLVKAAGHDGIRGGVHNIFAKGYVNQQKDLLNSGIASIYEKATEPVVFDTFEPEDETVEVPDLTYDEVISGIQLPEKEGFNWKSLGQALPIISNAAKALYNAATPIDYSNVIAEQAYRETPMMSLPRLGGKQVYRGIDKNRLINPIINQGRATARDIQNTALTSGQALANLANVNYNTQRATGEAYANAEQQDLANKLQLAQFNLGIDQVNANLSQAEQAANIQRANRIAAARIQDAAMREQLQQMKGQAFDITSNTAVQGVADLARQNIEWNWIKNNPQYAEAVAVLHGKKANGGMLTRKKRRK